MRRRYLLVLGALPFLACGSQFRMPDAARPDRLALVDAGGTEGIVVDNGGADTAVRSDSNTQADQRLQDHFVSNDSHVTDLTRPDQNSISDVPANDRINEDVSGGAAIGEHCESTACAGDAICVGDSSNAICRVACVVGSNDCEPSTERCLTIRYVDGGTAPSGACVPANGVGETCSPEPCAQIYTCARFGEAGYTCHYPCLPSAADAACPNDLRCLAYTGQDAGACF